MAKKPVMMGHESALEYETRPAKAIRKSAPLAIHTIEDLDPIVVAFNNITSNRYEIPMAKENEGNYRQVIIPGWPRNIHFEFVTRKNAAKDRKAGLTLELHDENGNFLRLKECLPGIAESAGSISDVPVNCRVFWKNPALVVQLPGTLNHLEVAESMLELINRTKDSISAAISSNR
ncbi:MAG: hypothetical protein WCP20_07945 [Desulfuromonadales bacterium]